MQEETKTPRDIEHGDDVTLSQMRKARSSPAALKANLALIRAYKFDCFVFICEGIDDKTVYFHWLRQIGLSVDYEFIVCNGKRTLLEFRDLLRRDVSGLSHCTYFFVDHDFDGLCGHPNDLDIYVTETYSVENELVNRDVLGEILTVDMHCHGVPQCREAVLERFDQVYAAFLAVTRIHNYRIYLARRLDIQMQQIPKKLNKLATVGLMAVEDIPAGIGDVVKLYREPSTSALSQLQKDFDELDPKRSYRGKFATLFFTRWLSLLAKDRTSKESVLFVGAPETSADVSSHFTLDAIAAKSRPPLSLHTFINSVVHAKLQRTSA
jgi:hypothetical protein